MEIGSWKLEIRRWGRGAILAPLCFWAALAGPVQAGEIRGWVRLAGPRPPEEFQPVFKHREFCGERMPSERIRLGAEGGVADVLVTLEGDSIQQRTQRPRIAVLDNRGCRFVPRVQVVPPGTRLEVRNSDPILHTVHAYLGTETLFHLALPVFRQRVWAILDRPGLIRLECDVGHTWMRAYILVRADAFAVVTGPDGAFRLIAPEDFFGRNQRADRPGCMPPVMLKWILCQRKGKFSKPGQPEHHARARSSGGFTLRKAARSSKS